MIYSAIHMATVARDEFAGNRLFSPDCPHNRDGLFNAFPLLRDKLLAQGIEINTPDIKRPVEFDIELEGRIRETKLPRYLIALESPLINPLNGDTAYLNGCRRVFGWADGGVMFPSNIDGQESANARDIFSCMIAGNKRHGGNLYQARQEVIDWYGESPLFHLYGTGWNHPAWRGEIPYKRDILERAKFCWCFENSSELPNWITEKIFDCFTAGCVPVYWGAPNVLDYIPAACFIDRRNFASMAAVHEHLLSISDADYLSMQQNIRTFLAGDAYRFGIDCFSTTIANAIAEDLCGS